MRLTACITTFNRPDFLEESLKSLCNQTDKRFSILILDNGSDRLVKKVIHKYRNQEIKIKYNKHMPISISKQRNLALDMVETDYLGFLDDDDIWKENKVEEFFNFLNYIDHIEIPLWYSGFKFFKQNNCKRSFSREIYDPNSDLKDLLLQRGDFTGSASNPIINVQLARNLNGYDNNIVTGEDYEFYLRLAKNHKFYFTPKTLTYIRQHQGSRLGGRLRDYVRTEIIIYRKFYGLYSDVDQILVRKIATKLIRLNKSNIARKLMKIRKITLNREYFLNLLVYLTSFLHKNLYLVTHNMFLKTTKKLRRIIQIF